MSFFGEKNIETAAVKNKVVKETKCTCNACGKIWHYGKKDLSEQRSAQLANASKALMCCSGCWPALFIKDKKVSDLTQCPQCNSRNIKTEEVSYEVAQ